MFLSKINIATTIINGVACLIFMTLFVFLYAIETRSSTFSTWTESVVLAATPKMASTISETNSTLLRICDNGPHVSSRLAMPLISFSMNNVSLIGTVFASSSTVAIDSKTLMGVTLVISLLFHLWRIYIFLEVYDHPPVHDQLEPDFLRWIEYTLTSPLQIVVICGTVYARNISEITQLATLQAALTLTGWTIEILISNLQIAKHYKDCNSHMQDFYQILLQLFFVFFSAVAFHVVIWANIITKYYAHEKNIQMCDFGLKELPPIIGNIVVVQCILFSLFGLIPLLQVLYILYSKKQCNTFACAELAYGILSVLSKGLLAIMFVKLITDDSCIYVNNEKICLYN